VTDSADEEGRVGGSVFLIGSFLATALCASEPSCLEFRFIGNAAFAITDGVTTLFTDFPYQSGAFGYMEYETTAVPPARGALCLITHGHLDHFDPALFRRMKAALIAPPSVTVTIQTNSVIPFASRMSYRDIRVEAFRTPHGDIEHYSYLVTWHGLRLYFTGDTDSAECLLAMRDLDVVFVSPWLLRAVGGGRFRIDARRVVVYHQRADEPVPDVQRRILPRQGETFAVEARHEP